MRKDFISTVLAVILGVTCLASISYAQLAVKKLGTQYGVAGAFNQGTNSGINWNFDGYNLTENGMNWTSLKAIDVSYGSHSGINWQSFGA